MISTDEVYVGEDMTALLTEELESMNTEIEGKAPTNHNHSGYAAANHTHTASEVGAAAENHTHTPASIGAAAENHTHSGYAASSHTHAQSEVTDLETALSNLQSAITAVQNALSGKAESNHTHAQSEITGLETALSDLQTAINGKAASSHTHDDSYIQKSLQFINDIGGVEYSYAADSGANMLDVIAAWGQGFHTGYFAAGLSGNPNTTEAFRVLMHKTSATIGWLITFGSSGSVYSNYQHTATSFRGWKRIVSGVTEALWSGVKVMNDTQTVTPSKTLTECQNGWILEWCDYDSNTGTVNPYNYVHTPIYKRNVAGSWSGQNMMFTIPVYIANDGTTAVNTVKQLTVHNDKLVGHVANGLGTNNQDAVLRAVYEF